MKKIRLAGVPEHFNLPWHIAYEEGLFDSIDVDLEFIDHPGGTGAMSQSLLEDKVDMALLLTEGAVNFISKNPSYKIIKFYVDSPLLWGVHVGEQSKIVSTNQVDQFPFAISRLGSGSHLMAYVYAQSLGLNTANLKFEIIKNLDGLRAAYSDGLEASFLWEKFTTKPFVDNGEMRRIDVCPTPWPCFVLVAHEDFIEENHEDVSNVIDAINVTTSQFKSRPNLANEIANRYELKEEDVEEWLADTEWNSDLTISRDVLEEVVDQLVDLEIIESSIDVDDLVSELTELQ